MKQWYALYVLLCSDGVEENAFILELSFNVVLVSIPNPTWQCPATMLSAAVMVTHYMALYMRRIRGPVGALLKMYHCQ